MRTGRRLAAVSLVVGLAAALTAGGCGGDGDGGSDGARSYLGKASGLVLYVSWNRSGSELKGAVSRALANGETHTVSTKRFSMTGEVSGSGVSLELDDVGRTTTLTGRLDGDELRLEYPAGDAGLTSVRLEQASAQDYEGAVATLRGSVEQAAAEEKSAAAAAEERDRIARQAQAVEDDLSELRAAVAAARGTRPGESLGPDVTRVRRTMEALRRAARAALSASSSEVCAAGSAVQTAFTTLQRDIAALRREQTTSGDVTTPIAAAIDKLREDFILLEDNDPDALPADAPGQRVVGRAIQSARRALRRLARTGGGTSIDTEAMLVEAQRLLVQANTACSAAHG